MSLRPRRAIQLAVACALWALLPGPVRAQSGSLPELRPVPKLGPLAGRPVRRIEVITRGGRWRDRSVVLKRVKTGEPFGPEVTRRAMQELADTGRYAEIDASASAESGGVVLRLTVLPRRIIDAIRLSGTLLDEDETLRDADVRRGGEVTVPELARISKAIRDYYVRHGFPLARVRTEAADTDEPLRVVVRIAVSPGPPQSIGVRALRITPRPSQRLRRLAEGYAFEVGDRVDEEALARADRQLQERLQNAGWYRARVSHDVSYDERAGSRLIVTIKAGPRFRVRFEGNRRFDADQLLRALKLEDTEDRSRGGIADRLRTFYVRNGFLDVEVTHELRGHPQMRINDLVFHVRENSRVRVAAREYPCLSGARTAEEVGDEIDSFLSELPGSVLVGSVDPGTVDETFGPHGATGARPVPFEPNPWATYSADVYDKAIEHLRNLYRSEGYLSARVGPVVLARRACSIRSPPGQCRPIGRRERPKSTCAYDDIGLPLPEPEPDRQLSCVPDPKRHIRCEPDVVVHIPIKLGPRAILWDIAFEGNERIVETRLEDVAELEPGKPVNQVEIEAARRRLLDEYAEEGHAFASVETELDSSSDRTRARARFVINESERVTVSGIVVRGARRTNESLVLRRVALEVGKPYRRSLVRKTEERLATLGVFSSVNVGFEDPYVPAREKVVVITVQERQPQYLEVRPGISTGEGFRIAFEYGHRNLGGEAIRFTLRVQLGYLPDAFIVDDQVRANFGKLQVSERLERRNTAGVEFPEIGLGPLIRLSVEGVDVRDLVRDFGITKRAGIVTLIYRPNTRFSASLGGSVELNDADLFATDTSPAFRGFLARNPIPEGETVAVAQRTGLTWDLRDNPLGATKGGFFSAGVEHVRSEDVKLFGSSQRITSDFLKLTNRIAGYVRLNDAGLSWATSFSWGYNYQLLAESETYPDRLFFMGGVDSLRGFPQQSLIPEDVAAAILAPGSNIVSGDVVIRGGNVMLNPRTELRIPLGGVLATTLFLDTGNLWVEPTKVEPFTLRYAAGSGIRANTPIGPLAFDYGVNLDRRPWEDFGAFHFSIGLF